METNKQHSASTLEDKSENSDSNHGVGSLLEAGGEGSVSVVPNLEGFNVLRERHVGGGSGNGIAGVGSGVGKTSLLHRRRRMQHHFEDLSECYFTARSAQMMLPPNSKNVFY